MKYFGNSYPMNPPSAPVVPDIESFNQIFPDVKIRHFINNGPEVAEKCLSRGWMSYNWFQYPNLFQFNEEGKREIDQIPIEFFDFNKVSTIPFPTTLLQYGSKTCAVFITKGHIVFRSFPNNFKFDESIGGIDNELEVFKTTAEGIEHLLRGELNTQKDTVFDSPLFKGLATDELREYTNIFIKLFLYVTSIEPRSIVVMKGNRPQLKNIKKKAKTRNKSHRINLWKVGPKKKLYQYPNQEVDAQFRPKKVSSYLRKAHFRKQWYGSSKQNNRHQKVIMVKSCRVNITLDEIPISHTLVYV